MKKIASASCVGILMGLFVDMSLQYSTPIEVVNAQTIEEPKEVRLEVVINWTPERIEKEIRNTFPESPEIALAVFRCESSLNAKAVSHTNDFGIAQINKASWHKEAMRLGLTEYQTDVKQNLQMARHVYEKQGWSAWVCYNKMK